MFPAQKDEFLRLAINGIHNDLISRNEAFQSLALTFVSNSKSGVGLQEPVSMCQCVSMGVCLTAAVGLMQLADG